MYENGIRPARDPYRASAAVQKVARDAAKRARRQTRAIKTAVGRSSGTGSAGRTKTRRATR